MVFSRLTGLLVTSAAVLVTEGVAGELEAAAALAFDDECETVGESEDCTLNAIQLRASHRKLMEQQAAEAAAEAPPSLPGPPTPDGGPMDDSNGDLLDPDDESGKSDDEDTEDEDDDDTPKASKKTKKSKDDDDDDDEKESKDDDDDDDKKESKDDDDDDEEKASKKASSGNSSEDASNGTDVEVETSKPYKQCGGEKWKGATACTKGFTCMEVDEYYSQCRAKGSKPPKKKKHHHKKKNADDDEEEDTKRVQEPLAKQESLPKARTVKDLNAVVVKGNFLYDSKTGDRFFSKGVAYNPRNVAFDPVKMKSDSKNCTGGHPPLPELAYDADPTSDSLEEMWKPALNAIADLGANTVRLYNIDPEISHKKFMDTAKSLGIYVIIPLTRHDWGFLPANSPSPACYEEVLDDYGNVGTNLLTSAKLIVKQFSQYENTLLFTVANELTVQWQTGYAAMPCVKALTRDIHQYQSNCSASMRRVPLIYADMDMGPPYRELVGRYLTCELESPEDAVDAYGLNVYSYCDSEYPNDKGVDDFKYSPYDPIKKEFDSFSKPLLFTEFGCNIGEFETECPYHGGRTWPDVKTFFNEFSEIMSGAIAFEFSMEDNQYGLTMTPGYTSDPNNKDNIYYLDTYFALQKQFEKYNVSTKWNGAKITDCKWVPADAHKMSHKHPKTSCPDKDEVEKLFEDKNLRVKPNWDKLPPLPSGADQGKLATCADDDVPPILKKEGCCHMECASD